MLTKFFRRLCSLASVLRDKGAIWRTPRSERQTNAPERPETIDEIIQSSEAILLDCEQYIEASQTKSREWMALLASRFSRSDLALSSHNIARDKGQPHYHGRGSKDRAHDNKTGVRNIETLLKLSDLVCDQSRATSGAITETWMASERTLQASRDLRVVSHWRLTDPNSCFEAFPAQPRF